MQAPVKGGWLPATLSLPAIAALSLTLAGAPGADGLELKRQNLAWVLPYHPGAVKAIKEAGAWTPEAQAHNDKLLERQSVLASAWKGYLANKPSEDKDAFYKGWMAQRKDALVKAGFDPIFD